LSRHSFAAADPRLPRRVYLDGSWRLFFVFIIAAAAPQYPRNTSADPCSSVVLLDECHAGLAFFVFLIGCFFVENSGQNLATGVFSQLIGKFGFYVAHRNSRHRH
jgi:hypothetical protein